MRREGGHPKVKPMHNFCVLVGFSLPCRKSKLPYLKTYFEVIISFLGD